MKKHLLRLSLAFCLALALLGSLPAAPVRAATFTLTVQAHFGFGGGTGTVTASGIDCRINSDWSTSGDCTEAYPMNTVVTLTPNPDPDSNFVMWSGDCNANGQVTMAMDKTCLADFILAPVYHTVTVIGAGNGNGTVTGGPAGGYWIDCAINAASASGDCSKTFISTTSAWLAAQPDPDSTFDGWSGDCDATGMVTLEADKTCIATFNLANSAPTDITLSNNSVAENLPAGTLVGTLSTTDPDAGNTHTYSFCGGADDASFQIGGSDLLTNAAFDFETKNSYNICVRTDDGNGGSLDKTFTINVTDVIETLTATFRSVGAYDGWILESAENSNAGGSLDKTAATFNLGDNAQDKQYRAILSFSTLGLPDNAVITKVTFKVRKQSISGGGNPVTIFQGFMVDIKRGLFGTSTLQLTDFQAPANKTYGPFNTTLIGGWYTINLTSGKAYINKLSTNSGLTQIRLRFKLDDNSNAVANYLSLYSGNAGIASRPQLIIEYYTP